ncbi:MAG: hypothetical protein D6737_07140 [Chloroflexi bacterium]|nr:MAG: hypothetical protein D6737_07140 [Chloroflexota bacterium]
MHNSIQPRRALALVGMPGAGKTLCARHLEQCGFYQFRFGSIIVDEVVRRGLPVEPENERIVREEFRERDGMAAIAKLALPRLNAELKTRTTIVIDGLYGFSEYKLLREQLHAELIVVAIVSSREARYQRLATRSERPLTREEAERRDFQEIERLEKGGPIAIADYTLLNHGTPEDLLMALDELLDSLGIHP